MSYRIKHITDEPIVLVTLDTTFSVAHDLSNLSDAGIQLLDSVGPVFYIVDVRNVRASFEDLVVGSSASARGAGTILHHPNIRELIVVTEDKLIMLSVKGLGAPVFGGVAASTYARLEDAIAHARERIVAVQGS